MTAPPTAADIAAAVVTSAAVAGKTWNPRTVETKLVQLAAQGINRHTASQQAHAAAHDPTTHSEGGILTHRTTPTATSDPTRMPPRTNRCKKCQRSSCTCNALRDRQRIREILNNPNPQKPTNTPSGRVS